MLQLAKERKNSTEKKLTFAEKRACVSICFKYICKFHTINCVSDFIIKLVIGTCSYNLFCPKYKTMNKIRQRQISQ